MSLILDALRKADAERERGSVPSLHSQPVVPASAEQPPQPRGRPNWIWIAVGIAVGLTGAAAWFMLGRNAPQATAPLARQELPQPAAPVLTLAPTAAPAAAPTVDVRPPAAAPADLQGVAEPAPWRQPDERKAPAENAPAARPAASPAAPAAVDSNVYSRDQLPPNVRAEVPQLAIGGSMYSATPAARSLIVNGQLYREKDRLTQDLSLEEIRLKGAIFSFRGYRFEVLF